MPTSRKKTAPPPRAQVALRTTRSTRGKKIVVVDVDDQEDDSVEVIASSSVSSSSSVDNNLSSRHPARSATTTTTNSDTNPTEDSNSRINRAATTSTAAATNVNNNGRVNTNSAAVNVGGITTRRSRSISQAQQNKNSNTSSSPSSGPPTAAVIASDQIIDVGEELNLNLFTRKKATNIPTNNRNKDDEEEDLLSKSSTSEEEESDPTNLVVISNVLPPPPVRSSEDEEDGNSSHSPERAESVDSEGDVAYQASYSIIVNPDGSLHLVDDDTQINLVPGQEQFSVTLPKNKVKSPNNPLPGAVLLPSQQGRARKSKPEGSTYGTTSGGRATAGGTERKGTVVDNTASGSKITKEATMSVGINQQQQAHPSVITSTTPVSLDIDEFTNSLDPQSLATLENLIQSQQAELIENLNLEHHDAHMSVSVSSEGGQNKWTDGRNQQNSMGSLGSESSVGGMTSPGSSAASAESSPSAFRDGNRHSAGGGRPLGTSRNRGSSMTSSSRLSESDSNIRRSQRQQDRIERQEAERIMAENQQMLQREKELMQGAKASGSSSPFPPVASKKIESPSQITGIVAAQTTPPPTKPALVGRASASSSIASSRDSIDSSESDNRKPYPKRENRRLPAHLADPNYISLEEEGGPRASAEDIFRENLGGPDESKEKESPMEVDDDDYVQEENEDGEDDYTEDDPNKLWCICRQPHNNRFMICCDTCEEWFHGKCVGVTKAQGKAMELKNILWVCPPCRKAELELKRNAKAAERASNSARRSTSTSGDKNDARRLSKGAAALQADAAAAAVVSKTAFMPNLSKKGSLTTATKKRSESRSDESKQSCCVVCSKPPRKDSIYCSDQCVQKHADNVGNKSATQEKGKISLAESPTSSSPNKLKRMNSKPDVKSSEPIFNFHVISAGATKSTEVAPPKPKEMTASQILKAQKEAQSPTKVSPALPSVVGVSPNSVSSIISSTPSVLVKKMSEGKINVKLPGKSSPDEEERPSKSTRTSSQSETKNKSSTRKSDSSKNKEKERDTASSNKLHRDILRKSLREILKRRMEELSDSDKKKFNDGPNNPDALADKITDELCKTYGGANTPKCKNKYRGIYFNLKAEKNDMYKELLNGNLKPKNLVRMESHDMASADLIEWRKKEAEKEIEAIKKAELDKITESKKIALLEKGVDDAAKVAEELRPLDISDVIDQSSTSAAKETDKEHSSKEKSRHHSTSEKSKDHSSSSSRRDRDKGESSSKSSSNKDKRDKDRRRSDRHKDSSSHRDKDRKSSSSSHRDSKTDKEKVKHSDSKHKENDKRVVKDSESNCQVSSGSGTDEQSKSPQLMTELAPKITPPSNEEVSSSPSSVDDKVNLTPKPLEQQDTEQEQPSSTIKTPDFVEDGVKKDSEPKHLFQTKIVMPELGSFHASAHGVSHAIIDGVFFPKSPVPVVGRISPDTVWDYINKMKKSKEVIVFRLSPASPADSSDYMTFFSYFSSRSRLGVIGGIESPLKDVYLVPLPKQAPIPRCLLPFRGPGLPNERTHCLLCIVTRNIRDPSATASGLKRKPSILVDQALGAKKRAKLDFESEEKLSSPSTGLRSRTITLAKPLAPTATAAADPKVNDDDAPYTPWEDESTSSNSDSQPPLLTPETLLPGATLPPKQSVDVKKQLEELDAKIAREKQDIEKITGALAGRSSMSGIPGLDGEFGEDEGEAAVEKMETEDSSPPEIVAITPPPPVIAPAVVQESTHMSDPRLRRSQRYGNNSGVTVQSSVPAAVESLPVVEKKDSSPVEILDLGSSDDSSSKDEPDGKEKKESEEEAYSPSAIQFSDEETNDSQDAKNKTVVVASSSAPPVVVPPETPETTVAAEEKGELSSKIDKFPVPPPIPKEVEVMDVEDDEPLPPGDDVYVERPQLPPPSVTLISTFKPVVTHIDDIKITMPKTPTKTSAISSSAQQQQQSQTVQQSTVDLDDFQQPMRSLAVKQTESKVESSSIFEKQSGSGSGAGAVTSPLKSLTISGGPSTGGSKMKININLITKQLPVAVDTSKTEEVAAVASSPTPPATQILHPPPPTSLFSQPALKPIIIPAPASPLKILEPLHLQQQPPNPIMLPATTMPPPVPSIPTHIPPPNLLPPPLNGGSSMVINLNVPPPSFMMSRPPPSTVPSPVGFPPLPHHQGYPPRVPFTPSVPPQTAPPPSLPPSSMLPASSRMGNPPGFMPTFGSTSPQHGQFPGPKTPVMTSGERERDREAISRNVGDTSEDAARVQRINLDRSGGGDRERDRPFRGRGHEIRGGSGRHRDSRPDRDNFPRRRTGGGRINRSPIQRIRRRRSGSRDRSRSRSRSPGRDRRHRKRTSRSRSKSPLSRRWEARNRSRSRSAGRRVVGRNKSRTPSPRRRRSSRSRSPKRIARRAPSPKSRSPSPPSPLLRPVVAPKNLPAPADSDEDWEGESARNTDAPLQPIAPSEEERLVLPNIVEN